MDKRFIPDLKEDTRFKGYNAVYLKDGEGKNIPNIVSSTKEDGSKSIEDVNSESTVFFPDKAMRMAINLLENSEIPAFIPSKRMIQESLENSNPIFEVSDEVNSYIIETGNYVIMDIGLRRYAISKTQASDKLQTIINEIDSMIKDGKIFTTKICDENSVPTLTAYDLAYIKKRYREFMVTVMPDYESVEIFGHTSKCVSNFTLTVK